MGEASRMKAVQGNPLESFAKAPSRAVFSWEVPEPLCFEAFEGGEAIKSFSLTQLTAQEELNAMKRCGTDSMKMVFELAKQSLVAVNGQKVSLADGSADKAVNEMLPPVRELFLSAYSNIHTAGEEVKANFLKSRSVKVV